MNHDEIIELDNGGKALFTSFVLVLLVDQLALDNYLHAFFELFADFFGNFAPSVNGVPLCKIMPFAVFVFEVFMGS